MHIGIVGGLDRNAPGLASVARAAGHELSSHNGVLAGKASVSSLRALVLKSDIVFIVTEINSHNAVRTARSVAKAHHRPIRIVRRLGLAEFSAYLDAKLADEGPLQQVA